MKHNILAFVLLGLMAVLTACEDPARTSPSSGSVKSTKTNLMSHLLDKETVVASLSGWPSEKYATAVDSFDDDPTRSNIVIVLDFSGSMKEHTCSGDFNSKAEAAKNVFMKWLPGVPDETNVGLITFSNSKPVIQVPLGRGEANRNAMTKIVTDILPNGGTPLSTSVALAHEMLAKQASWQQGYGKYQMIVVTDGAHSQGFNPYNEVMKIYENAANPVEIHTIGFCIKDSALNIPGLTYYQSAENPKQLLNGFESVLAESESFDPVDFDAK